MGPYTLNADDLIVVFTGRPTGQFLLRKHNIGACFVRIDEDGCFTFRDVKCRPREIAPDTPFFVVDYIRWATNMKDPEHARSGRR